MTRSYFPAVQTSPRPTRADSPDQNVSFRAAPTLGHRQYLATKENVDYTSSLYYFPRLSEICYRLGVKFCFLLKLLVVQLQEERCIAVENCLEMGEYILSCMLPGSKC